MRVIYQVGKNETKGFYIESDHDIRPLIDAIQISHGRCHIKFKCKVPCLDILKV
jgi:hypothetical protein